MAPLGVLVALFCFGHDVVELLRGRRGCDRSVGGVLRQAERRFRQDEADDDPAELHVELVSRCAGAWKWTNGRNGWKTDRIGSDRIGSDRIGPDRISRQRVSAS